MHRVLIPPHPPNTLLVGVWCDISLWFCANELLNLDQWLKFLTTMNGNHSTSLSMILRLDSFSPSISLSFVHLQSFLVFTAAPPVTPMSPVFWLWPFLGRSGGSGRPRNREWAVEGGTLCNRKMCVEMKERERSGCREGGILWRIITVVQERERLGIQGAGGNDQPSRYTLWRWPHLQSLGSKLSCLWLEASLWKERWTWVR